MSRAPERPRAPRPIRHKRDFAALAASRDRARSGPLRLARAPFAADERLDGVEVGFAIGRSVGAAVVRNRIRRRLRVLMRDRVLQGVVADGRYLVSVSPAAADATFAELGHHLDVALGQLS